MRWNQNIAESVAELVGQYRHLPAHAHEVCQRCHDRHGDEGLTASRGDEEVGEALHEEHPHGGKDPRKLLKREADPVDHCIHYAALVQHHLDTARYTDQKGNARKARCAPAELHRCTVRSHAGNDGDDEREGDEHPLHLVQVPVQPDQPVDKDDHSDANDSQDQLVRSRHRRMVCHGLSIAATGDRLPVGCVHVSQQARRRIAPHFLGIGPDVVNTNRHKDRYHHQAVPKPRPRLESRNILGEKCGKGVDDSSTVTGAVPNHDNRHSREPVVSQRQSQGDEDGDEGKILFAESDGARPNGEKGNSAGHQPEGSIAPAPQESVHSSVHCPGGPKNGERSSDDEDEEDDLVRSAETLGNGRQAGQGRQRRSLRSAVEAARHYLQSSFVILHPVEGSGRNHVSEDLGQDHHPKEDNQRLWDLKFAFRHNEIFLLTLAFILLGRDMNQTLGPLRTSRTNRESARAGPFDSYVF